MVSIEDLRRQVLFEDLDNRSLEKIAQRLRILNFKKGETLFGEGDEARGIYLINSGKIEITKATPDGWRQTIAHFGPGNFCGELSIIENRKHEAKAVATENVSVYFLSVEDFQRIETEDLLLASEILKKLVLILSRNIRLMNERFLKALVNY
ncbi:MAG: cyclic nucleotide-binding domain-containing protein [Thermodesulfovibrionales bacterium]